MADWSIWFLIWLVENSNVVFSETMCVLELLHGRIVQKFVFCLWIGNIFSLESRGCRGCDRMVVCFTTICNQCLSLLTLWVRIPFRWGVLDTLYVKVYQWLAAGWWFSPVSSTNKTDRHNITEILSKVLLNTIKPNQPNKNTQTNI